MSCAKAARRLTAGQDGGHNNEMTPTPLPLWPTETPFGPSVAPPTLTRYDPPVGQSNGSSIVVCPGGGYTGHADHEGAPVAAWLTTLGVTAFVLHYRLGPHSRHPDMLHDAARAVQTARATATEDGRDPARVGILGFSAGGHLAATLATGFEPGDPESRDPLARLSSRPDLAILLYPVITFQGPHAHAGSRAQLLGEDAPEALIASVSAHLRVTSDTPPAFLLHTAEDEAVPPENSLLFAQALSAARVPFELHIYERGAHGIGLGGDDPVLSAWPDQCANWLAGRGFTANGREEDNKPRLLYRR